MSAAPESEIAPPAAVPLTVAEPAPTEQPAASTANAEPQWGRLLICGGTDWPRLGRKDKGGKKQEADEDHPELPSPHVLRSLATVRVVSIHTSSVSCHAIVLALDGTAYLFGRNVPQALGAAHTEEAKAWGAIDEREPKKVIAAELEGAGPGERFVHAACGKSHSLLVTSAGRVYSAGANTQGQCGHAPQPEITSFKLISGPWADGGVIVDPVIQASAGITFSLVLTQSGKVYSFGSSEAGQLGNNKTGERIVSAGKVAFDIEWVPTRIKGLLDGRKIVQIASGPAHSLVLDHEGQVYVFGAAGYCRLGLGNQNDVTSPKIVPQFAGAHPLTRGTFIAAGPTCSVVIDGQGMYWLAGKWKTSGDGSAGQPWSSFKYVQDIMSCKMKRAACGGVTLFGLCPDDENDGQIMTVGWGQNAASSELGLGEGEPKSATKPQRIEPLRGMHVIDVAAGAHTTYFLARPNDELSSTTRHPVDVDSPEHCAKCGENKEGDDMLECEKCDEPWHLECVSPPLSAVPEGEFFCPACLADDPSSATKIKSKPKPKAEKEPSIKEDVMEEDPPEDVEMTDTPRRGVKRKAAAKAPVKYADDDEDEDEDFDELDDDEDERPKRRKSTKRGGAAGKRKK